METGPGNVSVRSLWTTHPVVNPFVSGDGFFLSHARPFDFIAAGCDASHYHYHVLRIDGVITVDMEHAVRFHEATGLNARDAEALARTVQFRVLRWFARRGLTDRSAAADMRTWRGTGGFSIDGSVRIKGEDRAGLERLVRYCARGPLALERLQGPAGIAAASSP